MDWESHETILLPSNWLKILAQRQADPKQFYKIGSREEVGRLKSSIPFTGDVVSAVLALALGLTGHRAGVGREGLALAVGLPDVHLRAAGAEVAGAGVGVVVGWLPVPDVGLSVDPLEVVGALSVAVAGSVLCSGLDV